jgi:hypothetical protein
MPGIKIPSLPCGVLMSTDDLDNVTSLSEFYEFHFLFSKENDKMIEWQNNFSQLFCRS